MITAHRSSIRAQRVKRQEYQMIHKWTMKILAITKSQMNSTLDRIISESLSTNSKLEEYAIRVMIN